MAIKGVGRFYRSKKKHIITTQTVRRDTTRVFTCSCDMFASHTRFQSQLKNNVLCGLFIVKVMGTLTLGVIHTTCLEDGEGGGGVDHWLSSVRWSDSTPPPLPPASLALPVYQAG